MKYSITTLGCKVNQYETQSLETLLQERGHGPADCGGADVVIINTCAVTAESGRKSRQAVRRMMSENPGAISVVCGCFSQIEPQQADSLGADIVYGSGDRLKLIDDIERVYSERSRVVRVDDPFKRTEFELLPAGAVSGRTRAMLKIQDGCDNFCAYCIIPYARGRVRSLPVDEAARQAEQLQRQGYAELVITGIEISSYGKDFRGGATLIDAVTAIAAAAPGLRLRLGSLEPSVITEEFCRRLALAGNVCGHFHLSLQSGCDATLARMRRKYDTARFYQAVETLRTHFPRCGLTADLITGFPGETETEHRQTLEFIRKCAFSSMHIFPYSMRPETAAARMEGQLTRAVKNVRAKQAQLIADEMKREFLISCVGSRLPVLFESGKDVYSRGYADNYCEVRVADMVERSVVRTVEITGAEKENLVGIIV